MQIMHRLGMVMLAVMLFHAGLAPSQALAASEVIRVVVDGKEVKYTQPPVVRDSTTLVSARETLEAFGLAFNWDKANKRIIATSTTGETTVTLVMGQRVALVNGMTVFMDSKPIEVNGRIMIPLRSVTKALGASLKAASNALQIQTVSEKEQPYYTGLPLEITNTYAKNNSKQPLTLHYELLLVKDRQLYTQSYDLDILPGKKGIFEGADLYPPTMFVMDETQYGFLGRVPISVEFWDKSVNEAIDSAELFSQSYGRVSADFNSGKLFDDYIKWFKVDLREELRKNNNVPLKVDKAFVTHTTYEGSDYKLPVVNLELYNLTEKEIVEYSIEFKCYDSEGKLVRDPILGKSQVTLATESSLISGGGYLVTANLYSMSNAVTINHVTVTKVVFEDGTVWTKNK